MVQCCGPSPPRELTIVTTSQQEAACCAVTWEGWGTSLCWFAHALGGNPTACEAICRLLFSKDNGLGFNIVRYNIGGANQQHVQEYRAGAAVPCFIQPDGTYDWTPDAGQVSMLLAAARLGADTFEAFCNSPPWFWTVSGSSRGHHHPLRSNLDKAHVQDFARFCDVVLAHFKAAHGITFRSLSPFNEPASPAWCLAANCKQEGCFFSRRRAHQVLRALQEQPGLQDTELIAFEQFCIRDTLTDLHHVPKELRSAIARVNTHTYDSSTFFHGAAKPLVLLQDNKLARQRLRKLLHKWDNKPLWVSEFGTGRGALKLAAHLVKDIATLLPSAWVYWQAVEGLNSGWGLMEMPISHPGEPAAAPAVPAAAPAPAAAAAPAAPAVAVAAAEGICDSSIGAAAEVAASGGAAAPRAAVQGSSDACPAGAGGRLGGTNAAQAQQQQQQQQEAAECSGSSSSNSVVLHPNYFVLHFMVKALPVGSRVCRVKGCGSRGFAVWQPGSAAAGSTPAHWSLVCVNPSKDKACSWRVAASSLPAGLPPHDDSADADAAASCGPLAVGDVDTPSSAPNKTPSSAAAAATPAAAASGGMNGNGVQKTMAAVVQLLDVAALQPVTVPLGDISTPPEQLLLQACSSGYRSLVQIADAAGGWDIEVPPATLCRVDFSG